MKFHYLQHVPFEGPAHIARIATAQGISLEGTRLYKGEPLPQPDEADLFIIMGGPMGVHDTGEFPFLKEECAFIERALRAEKKLLGICLGAQLMAHVLGAAVTRNRHREIGWFPVNTVPEKSDEKNFLPQVLPQEFYALHWHGDTFAIPESAQLVASSEACTNQAFLYKDQALGFQFHLESTVESVKDLLLNCSNELDNSTYVQAPGEILSTAHMAASNLLMEKVLEEFVGS